METMKLYTLMNLQRHLLLASNVLMLIKDQLYINTNMFPYFMKAEDAKGL